MMTFDRRSILLACGLASCLGAQTAEHDAKTLLTERAELVLQEDFTQPPAKPWLVKEPIWETRDGALQATHRTPFSANHGPLLQHPIALQNVIVQFSFKLEGSARLTLHFNTKNGHLCRAHVRTNAFYVIRRDSGGDKGVRLDSRETPIRPSEWHTLLVEVCGTEMLASLDGQEVIFGARDDLDQPKTMLILEAEAGVVWFKNLRLWKAVLNRNWESTRAALEEARKKATNPKQ